MNTGVYPDESCWVSLATSPVETTQDSLEPLNVSPMVASWNSGVLGLLGLRRGLG